MAAQTTLAAGGGTSVVAGAGWYLLRAFLGRIDRGAYRASQEAACPPCPASKEPPVVSTWVQLDWVLGLVTLAFVVGLVLGRCCCASPPPRKLRRHELRLADGARSVARRPHPAGSPSVR